MDNRLYHLMLKELEIQQIIVQEGPKIKLSAHNISLNPVQQKTFQKIEGILLTNGYKPTKVGQFYQDINQNKEVMDSLLMLVEQGILIRIASDTIIHGQALDKIKEMVKEYIQKKGGITIVEFRDNLMDLGRISIVKILEYFDSVGFTRRIGDMRVLKNH